MAQHEGDAPTPLDRLGAMVAPLTEDETREALAIAAWYAGECRSMGRPIPPDPLRSLLALCRHVVECNIEWDKRDADIIRDGETMQ